MTTVAIIGAGPLGRWLALAAARAGYSVLLEDVMPVNLHHAREALRQELSPAALPMVHFVSTIEEAVSEADLAIEQLETLAKIPNGASYGDLRLDPNWDPLRGDSRFEKIVASLAPK